MNHALYAHINNKRKMKKKKKRKLLNYGEWEGRDKRVMERG
jgi:hypothetical protein